MAKGTQQQTPVNYGMDAYVAGKKPVAKQQGKPKQNTMAYPSLLQQMYGNTGQPQQMPFQQGLINIQMPVKREANRAAPLSLPSNVSNQ